MRKIFLGVTACIVLLTGLMSCQDRIDEQFLDPEKTDKPSIPKFFTFMIDNSRVRPEYWNVRTFVAPHLGIYTQAMSFLNTNRRYQQNFSYLDDYWRDYYTPSAGGVVAQLREMERVYAMMTDEEKALNDVFIHAAKVLYYDQTAQMVDMWGDIPFTQAGSMNLTREVVLPEFDKAEDIYNAILAGLEAEAGYFATTALDPLEKQSFVKQDILLQGDMAAWRRYANSLRFRALMRISNKFEDRAKADILKMLGSPADYPLVSDAKQNILLRPQTTYLDNMRNALTEVSSHIAPKFLLDEVLKPASDPRIRVMYDKNVRTNDDEDKTKTWNETYKGMPSDTASSGQEAGIAKGRFALLDSITFLNNKNFPGIVMTSYEINFLKAEAYERWGGTTDAEAAYNQGVRDAVNFMFSLNELGLSGGAPTEEPLTTGELNTFMADPHTAYTGTKEEKLHKIWLQKWLSFGFWQATQNWAEVRRTDYPQLNFVTDAQNGDYKLPGSRLVYPPNEKTFNSVNYAKVSSQDTPTSKIFWDVN